VGNRSLWSCRGVGDLPASRRVLFVTGEDFFFIYDQPFGVNVAMVDGSVCYLPPGSFSIAGLLKMLRIGGFGEEEQKGIWSGADTYGGERHLNWPNIAALAVWLLSVGTLLTGVVRSRRRLSVPPTLRAG
jgi:prepilin-type processing-associated H-X9-DG protein